MDQIIRRKKNSKFIELDNRSIKVIYIQIGHEFRFGYNPSEFLGEKQPHLQEGEIVMGVLFEGTLN